MASFRLKNAHFLPPPFNPKFKNVSLALHSPNVARKEPRPRAYY